MPLTFKQFIREQGYPSGDYDPKKDPDSEVKNWDPRSDGEDKFKKSHTSKTKKKDHPVADEDQFDGGTKKEKSNVEGKGDVIPSGERKPVPQGTSTLDVKHGAGKSSYRTADKLEGDKKVPRVDYNSYNYGLDEDYLHEGIIEDLKAIAKKGKTEEVKFKNNDTLSVDAKSAKTIVDAFEDLSPSRRKKFVALIEKGESSFMKGLDFASSV